MTVVTPLLPRTRNDAVLHTLEPFLVSPFWHRALFDAQPFGLEIPPANIIDPTHLDNAYFFDRLSTLDRLTFGPEGMPMPRWVFYEGAEVPGGIFGFAHRAERLASDLAPRLELGESDTGLVPLSMYIAIPARPPDAWVGHNLASLNPLLPELNLHGLASMTKAMALKVFRCRHQIGATQWSSAALHIHTRFGALELLSAWTPAHADPASLTYQIEVTDETIRAALGDPSITLPVHQTTLEITPGDEDAMQALQQRIEAGERFWIPGPPRQRADGTVVVPVSDAAALQAA